MRKRVFSHLAEALAWRPQTGDLSWWRHFLTSAVCCLGLLVPCAAGLALGELSAGLIAAIGSLPVASIGIAPTAKEQWRLSLLSTIECTLAILCVRIISGAGWANVLLVPLIAAIVAVLGGISRPSAVFAARFTLVFAMALNMYESQTESWAVLLLMALGGAWTALLWLGAGSLYRRMTRLPPFAPSTKVLPWPKRIEWWRTHLQTLAGWSYPLRLFGCLVLAVTADLLYPNHHMLWIAFTVVLLLSREVEVLPIKVTQRTVGMLVGLLLVSGLLSFNLGVAGIILVAALVAFFLPALRERYYAGYSAAITVEVLLLLDMSGTPGESVLWDRMIATLAAATLVVAANTTYRYATAPFGDK